MLENKEPPNTQRSPEVVSFAEDIADQQPIKPGILSIVKMADLKSSEGTLPLELWIKVLEHQKPRDWKSSRLVSRKISALAATFLFRTVYVSPSSEDLRVLSLIANHPSIRRAVRNIIYDASVWVDNEKPEQAVVLQREDDLKWPTSREYDLLNLSHMWHREMSLEQLPVARVNQDLFSQVPRPRHSTLYKMEYAAQQPSFLRSPAHPMAVHLPGLLSRLIALNSVKFVSGWPGQMMPPSPRGRSWPTLCLRPLRWVSPDVASEVVDDLLDLPDEAWDGQLQFKIFMKAFARSKCAISELRITRLDLCPLATACFTDKTIRGCPGLLERFRHLKLLKLDFIVDSEYDDEPYAPLTGLTAVLQATRDLEELQLRLPHRGPELTQRKIDTATRAPTNYLYPLSELIQPRPDHTGFTTLRMDKLRTLELAGVHIPAQKLFRLLAVDLPSLRILRLQAIDLMTGTWEELLFGIRQCVDLHELRLGESQHWDKILFWHNEGAIWTRPRRPVDGEDKKKYIRPEELQLKDLKVRMWRVPGADSCFAHIYSVARKDADQVANDRACCVPGPPPSDIDEAEDHYESDSSVLTEDLLADKDILEDTNRHGETPGGRSSHVVGGGSWRGRRLFLAVAGVRTGSSTGRDWERRTR